MLVTLGVALVSIWLHELGHAVACVRYGDRLGARRWALNPLVNLDPIFSFLFPLATCLLSGGAWALGTGRPFLLERADWRVLLAGPVVNLQLATATAVAWWVTGAPVLLHAAVLNLALCMFNLLPFQPLDGWGLKYAYRAHRERRAREVVRVVMERPSE